LPAVAQESHATDHAERSRCKGGTFPTYLTRTYENRRNRMQRLDGITCIHWTLLSAQERCTRQQLSTWKRHRVISVPAALMSPACSSTFRYFDSAGDGVYRHAALRW